MAVKITIAENTFGAKSPIRLEGHFNRVLSDLSVKKIEALSVMLCGHAYDLRLKNGDCQTGLIFGKFSTRSNDQQILDKTKEEY